VRRAALQGPRSGFTSVEVLLGAVLMAGLMLVAGLATERALALFRQRRATDLVGSTANRALQRVASELVFARRSSLVPNDMPSGSSTVSFQKSLGVTDGDAVWSNTFSLEWELEPGETDDGSDEDGDGLVDEGQLVRVQDDGLASETRVVLAHGLCELLPGETFDGSDEDGDGLIDERGLCFSTDGDVVTVRLGVQGQGPDGRTITRVVETAVWIRNSNE
jgi:hypothetical protein